MRSIKNKRVKFTTNLNEEILKDMKIEAVINNTDVSKIIEKLWEIHKDIIFKTEESKAIK
jgi:hypothetical protein